MACPHERRFLFRFDGQAKRLLWFFFPTSTLASGKADNKASRPNYGLSNMFWYPSVLPGQIQMHCFSLGCFSTLQYQTMSVAQSLGEVGVLEMWTFFGVSEAYAKSPTEVHVTETPMDQQLLSVSQQGMAKQTE